MRISERHGNAGLTAALVCVTVATVPIIGCGSSNPAGIPPGATLVPSAEIDTLVDESYSGVTEPRREVFRSDSAWGDFWETVHQTRSPRPEVPEIEFGRQMVIAVAMGQRPTGGYAIDIEAMYRDDGTLHVLVLETSPGPSCGTTQALTQPVLAVAVAAAEGKVAFHEDSAVTDCT